MSTKATSERNCARSRSGLTFGYVHARAHGLACSIIGLPRPSSLAQAAATNSSSVANCAFQPNLPIRPSGKTRSRPGGTPLRSAMSSLPIACIDLLRLWFTMLLPEIRSIQPAPNRAVELTLWMRTGSKSLDLYEAASDDLQAAGYDGEEIVEPGRTFPAVLRNGESMKHSTFHLGSTRHRMDLERRHVLRRVAAAADTPLKVARHARTFVEYRAQAIAPCQRITCLPIMLEQGQTSLLDRRTGLGCPQNWNSRSLNPEHPRAQEHRDSKTDPSTSSSQYAAGHGKVSPEKSDRRRATTTS